MPFKNIADISPGSSINSGSDTTFVQSHQFFLFIWSNIGGKLAINEISSIITPQLGSEVDTALTACEHPLGARVYDIPCFV